MSNEDEVDRQDTFSFEDLSDGDKRYNLKQIFQEIYF